MAKPTNEFFAKSSLISDGFAQFYRRDIETIYSTLLPYVPAQKLKDVLNSLLGTGLPTYNDIAVAMITTELKNRETK